jgi:hypothetical protein
LDISPVTDKKHSEKAGDAIDIGEEGRDEEEESGI